MQITKLTQKKFEKELNKKHTEEQNYYGQINLMVKIKSKWKLEKIKSMLEEDIGARLTLHTGDQNGDIEISTDVLLASSSNWEQGE